VCFSTTVPDYRQILDLDFKLQNYEADLSVPGIDAVKQNPDLVWLSRIKVLGMLTPSRLQWRPRSCS
jgi:hypothetical protein